MPRGAGLAALPPPAPRSLVPPAGHPFGPVQRVGPAGGAGRAVGGSAGLRHLLAAAHGGRVGGWRRRGTPPLLSPSVQRDVLPGGTIIQDWQPYRPSESNLSCWRPRAWSGAWTAARARACSRCARAPSPSHLAATARGATSTSTPSAATARRFRASFCGICSARPRVSSASTSCASSSWRPSCGYIWLISARLADFCQAGLGLELVKGYTEQYLLEADI